MALVSRLFVHPGAAGRGAAQALLDAAVQTARQRGLVPALDVYAESQRAIRLYEYLGWQRTAGYTGHWLWRGEYPTVYVYLAPEPAAP
ncbi:MAG: GNAT family N-acetyltransferase [Deinococcus sp.]|nr:GNAT family N-acetyltransferase [Deinococcus sp.]